MSTNVRLPKLGNKELGGSNDTTAIEQTLLDTVWVSLTVSMGPKYHDFLNGYDDNKTAIFV